MAPYVTAEVRWFGRGEIPPAVSAWFDGLGLEVAPENRTDRYLAPTSDALGVKLREGQIEAKRRGAVLAPLAVGAEAVGAEAVGAEAVGAEAVGAEAAVEVWTKWSFPLAEASTEHAGEEASEDAADLAGDSGGDWIAVAKTRRQRHAEGGALELSRLEVAGQTWWSVCLEATDPDALARLAGWWLSDAPDLPAATASGYPAWLRAYGEGA